MPTKRTAFSVDEVFTYLDCPLKHEFQYNMKLKGSEKIIMSSKPAIYNDCIKQTIYYFYTNLQAGRTPTLKQLYSKFLKTWQEATGQEEKDIFNRDPKEGAKRGQVEKEKFIIKGYEVLQTFYEANTKIDQAILAVNHPYEIFVNGISIKGNFSLIREVLTEDKQRRAVEVVDFNMSKKKPNEFFLDHDLYSTFMHYAFVQTFKQFPDRFTANYINLDTEIVLSRTATEYKRMLRVIESFAQSVQHVKPYPRQSFMCQSCPFLAECDNMIFE